MQITSLRSRRVPDVVPTVSPKVLRSWLASGRRVAIVDVRESSEIDRSHRGLAGALAIPVHQLFLRRSELPGDAAEVVVTVSNQGIRSRIAAQMLPLLGVRDVRSLEGGLDAWAREGLPLE